MAKILLFSQNDNLSKTLSRLLSDNSYKVSSFSDPVKVINAVREKPYDLIFIDVPGDNVINQELLTSIHCFHEFLPIIVICADNETDIAQKAVKNGASSYVTKPLNPSALLMTLEITLSHANIRIENILYKRSLKGDDYSDPTLSSSDYMLKIYILIEKIAKSDSVVLLTGETGTGKETIARRIHAESRRHQSNFCKIDCAALPLNMQESELFGYARKIVSQKAQITQGIFEKNKGGTVFLDNIDVLPMKTQIKLLYLLHNKKIQLINSSEIINIDVRLIAGSVRDLHHQAISGEFCEDLYRKLSVIPIVLPPLRKRRKDITALAEHFLSRFANQNSMHVDISSQALAVLCEYDWPGNIEQLKTLIERLVTANETGQINCDELPPELYKQAGADIKWDTITDDKLDDIIHLKKYLQMQERSYIEKVLEHSGGDKKLAAKKLGISLASLYRKWSESML